MVLGRRKLRPHSRRLIEEMLARVLGAKTKLNSNNEDIFNKLQLISINFQEAEL